MDQKHKFKIVCVEIKNTITVKNDFVALLVVTENSDTSRLISQALMQSNIFFVFLIGSKTFNSLFLKNGIGRLFYQTANFGPMLCSTHDIFLIGIRLIKLVWFVKFSTSPVCPVISFIRPLILFIPKTCPLYWIPLAKGRQ